MAHGTLIAVDDGSPFGQQLAEVVAVEHEMRAAQHHRVDMLHVVLVEVAVQRAHHQVMVAEPPGFHDLHQVGARLLENRVVGIESIHQFGELPLTQGQGSGRHNHPLGNMMRVGRHVTTVARHFQGRLHADDRNIVVFAQIVHRGGSGGVACDDHGLDALTHEPFDNIETQGPHLFRRLDAVRCVGRITKIQHMLGRHILGDLASHGNTAKTRIEYADWSRRAHA